jgi:hypothetical protein
VKVTSANLIRWAGCSALVGGGLFMLMQLLHPADVLSSVTTTNWAIVHYLGVAMCLFSLLGLAGIYARQVERAGWLGLAGYLLFSFFYLFTLVFQFTEAFFAPLLAIEAPTFVEGLLGLANGHPTNTNLGAIPTVHSLTGLVGYLLGGVLFGVATLRAGVLPRGAAGLLTVGTLLPVVGSSLVPHPFDRIFAVPVGIALAWLGYALLSERRATVSEAWWGERVAHSSRMVATPAGDA